MDEFTRKVIVCAKDQEGLEVVNYSFLFLTKPGVNIEEAAMKAAIEFCQTESGKEVFEENWKCFNWGDFDINVPNEICMKYGFVKVSNETVVYDVDFNENLVSEEDVYPDEY